MGREPNAAARASRRGLLRVLVGGGWAPSAAVVFVESLIRAAQQGDGSSQRLLAELQRWAGSNGTILAELDNYNGREYAQVGVWEEVEDSGPGGGGPVFVMQAGKRFDARSRLFTAVARAANASGAALDSALLAAFVAAGAVQEPPAQPVPAGRPAQGAPDPARQATRTLSAAPSAP